MKRSLDVRIVESWMDWNRLGVPRCASTGYSCRDLAEASPLLPAAHSRRGRNSRSHLAQGFGRPRHGGGPADMSFHQIHGTFRHLPTPCLECHQGVRHSVLPALLRGVCTPRQHALLAR